MENVYLRVKGQLESDWSAWFDGLSITLLEPDQTLIFGTIADHAALHGVLNKIRDLGIMLISVECEVVKRL